MLSKLLYHFVIYPVSLLPFFLLYRLSDLLAFVLDYIVSYRKKVIYSNIDNSFPNKSDKEKKYIMHQFYKHFSDLVLEGLKGFSLSEKEVKKRVSFEGLELLDEYYKNNRDCIIVSGHYGNWEITGTSIALYIKHISLAIYKPLTNKFFDEKVKISRTSFGIELCSMKEVKEKIKEDLGKPKLVCFATDQSPSNPNRCYWTKFLNQDTGVMFGAEKYAVEMDAPVFYMSLLKPKRGYFHVVCKLITDNPKELPYGKITELHTQILENDILEKPEYWLWSHKRWKHKKPKNMQKV